MPKSFVDRFVLWLGLEGLWCYPASVLGAVIEGQSSQAIFSTHYFSVIIFIILTILSLLIIFWHGDRKIDKKYFWVLVPLVLSLFLNFYQLDKPDLNGDEYDLGYQAYNMVDGIFAGRKAYTLSFSAHPPLALDISHISMQLINNKGLDNLEDWQYRFAPTLLGSLTVMVFFFLILKSSQNIWLALICSVLLATNSYHIFLSRIFQRESFLTFYLIIFLYFLTSRLYLLASLFLGGTFLVKAMAIIYTPLLIIGQKLSFKKFIPFVILTIPIFIYNFAAYLTTGYMDIFFSRIFHTKTHPGATVASLDVYQNFQNIIKLLSDQFSLLVFVLGLVSILVIVLKNKNEFITRVMFLFTLISLAAFYLNGVRIYYLSFLAIPWSYFIGRFIFDLGKKGLALFLIIFIVNMFFTINTFFNDNPVLISKYSENIPEISWRDHSLTTRSFLEQRGWKILLQDLEKNYTPDSCLVLDLDRQPLQIRRYLGIGDKIKEFYLGSSYVTKYKLCPQNANILNKWLIYITDKEVVYERPVNIIR